MEKQRSRDDKRFTKNGFNYCRSYYEHSAGYVGASISEAMEECGFLKKNKIPFICSQKKVGTSFLSSRY